MVPPAIRKPPNRNFVWTWRYTIRFVNTSFQTDPDIACHVLNLAWQICWIPLLITWISLCVATNYSAENHGWPLDLWIVLLGGRPKNRKCCSLPIHNPSIPKYNWGYSTHTWVVGWLLLTLLTGTYIQIFQVYLWYLFEAHSQKVSAKSGLSSHINSQHIPSGKLT